MYSECVTWNMDTVMNKAQLFQIRSYIILDGVMKNPVKYKMKSSSKGKLILF